MLAAWRGRCSSHSFTTSSQDCDSSISRRETTHQMQRLTYSMQDFKPPAEMTLTSLPGNLQINNKTCSLPLATYHVYIYIYVYINISEIYRHVLFSSIFLYIYLSIYLSIYIFLYIYIYIYIYTHKCNNELSLAELKAGDGCPSTTFQGQSVVQ